MKSYCEKKINDRRIIEKILISLLDKIDPIMTMVEEIKKKPHLAKHT